MILSSSDEQNPSGLGVIDIQDDDLARQVLAVQRPSYQIESVLIDYPNLPPLFETVTDLQNSDETFVGYWLEGQLAGVLSYEEKDGGLYIGRLVVHPDYFRRGIGRALLGWLETAVSPPPPHITVSTAAKNQPAIQLYQAQGYTIVQSTTLPDGLELVLLRKTLSSRRFHLRPDPWVEPPGGLLSEEKQ